MATCNLCGKSGQGNVHGHIVPSWSYEITSFFGSTFTLGSKDQGYESEREVFPINRSKLVIKEHMFCGKHTRGCDQIIGDGESEIKRVFIDAETSSFDLVSGKFPHQVITPKKFSMITRGVAGILLKCYVSKRFRGAEHFNKGNHKLITLLKSAVLDDELSSKIIKLSVIKICTNIAKDEKVYQTAGYVNLQPLPHEKMFILTFGGISLLVFIDDKAEFVDNEINVFAGHISLIQTARHVPNFVPNVAYIYSQKYPISNEEIFLPYNEYERMYADIRYFYEFSNPDAHGLLSPSWLTDNTQTSDCICGNLVSNKNEKRSFETCCGKFWQL